jgi:two-component system sensor histidine kinase TctE
LKPKRADSLRLQLLRWLLIPLTLLLAVNAWFSNRAAVATANQAFDRLLLASADAIADQVSVQDGAISVDLPYVALQLLESNIQERVFYRVVAPDGKTVTGYDDLPLPTPGHHGSDDFTLYAAPYQGETIHLVARRKPLFGTPMGGTVVIVVAETAESRRALSREIVLEGLARQGLLIAATALLVWFGLGRGLKPLLRLRDSLLRRSATDLSPIDATPLQAEVRPLIDALNQHTARIEHLIQARQQFLADASHQMRTPLAEMRTQIEYSLRQPQPAPALAALQDLHASVDGLARLVAQMLSLARSDPKALQHERHEQVDLAALVRATTLDFVPAARKKALDLGFDDAAESVRVMGNPVLLRELVANLVDNAIHYSHRGGAIVVRVAVTDPGTARLEVEDNGPGIAPAERSKVFARFYRGGDRQVPGSGLGLAIVADICASHHARIELLDAAAGPGLRVRVEFPRVG